jgi:hypothetical protein
MEIEIEITTETETKTGLMCSGILEMSSGIQTCVFRHVIGNATEASLLAALCCQMAL